MEYVFDFIWFCWLLSEILLNRLMRSKNTSPKELDKNSLRWILLAIITSITMGIMSTLVISAPFSHSHFVRFMGLFLIIFGMGFRFFSIRTLGKFFTVDLAVHGDHRLIKNGLYKYIRHPSYTGSLISFLGFGLSLNNWIALIFILLPIIITFINRINIEERMLIDQFGAEYEEYRKTTKRLIPWIY